MSSSEIAPAVVAETVDTSSLLSIFLGFAKVGLLGFGGVLPSARRAIVVERRWRSEQEFAEMLALCQVLPGPNVINMSVFIGGDLQGPIGAVVATSTLVGAPLMVLLALLAVYDQFSALPAVQAAIGGMAAAGAGLVIGTALKMTRRLRPTVDMLVVGALAYLGAGIFGVPLPLIVVVLAVPGIWFAWNRK